LAVSVLPTQVGHKNKKLHKGFKSSFNHALALLIAFDTVISALSCHTTCFFSSVSSFNNFSFSVSSNFVAGIPVHLAIISAMSSLSTLSLKKLCQLLCSFVRFIDVSSIFFSILGISQYLILATSAKFHSLS
jgi:hypothetical protein